MGEVPHLSRLIPYSAAVYVPQIQVLRPRRHPYAKGVVIPGVQSARDLRKCLPAGL